MTTDTKPKVILIDDEADIRHLLTITLIQMKLDVVSCKNLTEARKALENESFDFCLTDLKLPDGDGLDLVSECKKKHPTMPVAVITAYSSTEKAIEAMKLGAFDFLAKPIDLNHLRQLLKHAFKFNKNNRSHNKETIYKVLAGNDTPTAELRKQVSKVQGSQASVVIEGGPGTEKEALAMVIHQQSSRSDQTIITLDLEALPTEQHEKALFYNKDEYKSYLLRANQGTLVINNIHLLSKPLQKRLLQCIEEKSTLTEDSYEPTPLDIRIILCSTLPLSNYVEGHTLREDLYFRLNVINLTIPSLSSRKDELETIIESYLEELNSKKSLSSEAMQKLANHEFFYNYRELENALLKAVALSEGDIITDDDLILIKPQTSQKNTTKTPSLSRGDKPLDKFLEDIEKEEIKKALEKTRWNRTEAAKLLKISFRTIRYKMKKLNIE